MMMKTQHRNVPPAEPGPSNPPPRSRPNLAPADIRPHIELDTLRQRQVAGIVDCVRRPAHIRLPSVGSGLAAAAGVLLAAEGSAYLGATRADIDIGDTAVG